MIWFWIAFFAFVAVCLAIDLGIGSRRATELSFRAALKKTAIWVAIGIAFSGVIYLVYENHWLGANPKMSGGDAAVTYLSGYLLEEALSVDNIFVISLIFRSFKIPAKYQHRVLFWGIIGALLMRGGMIFLGSELILRYQWILIFFGAFLLLTALKMALIKGHDDVSQNRAVRLARRLFPTVDFYDGQRFFTRRTLKPTYSRDAQGREVMDPPPPGSLSARWAITPLFLALLLVEITDLVFAVDSIPAIFAITPDPFIVFTSNIFAILGLRSLYFCLAVLITRFRFLKPALILILAFVGVKLLLLSLPPYLHRIVSVLGFTAEPLEPVKVDTALSLLVVVGVLAAATVASIVFPRSGAKHA